MPKTRRIALMLVALAAGCADLPSISPDRDEELLSGSAVPVTRLEPFPNSYSGLDARTQLVVESRVEWELVWRRMWGRQEPATPAPEVDFEREVVLVAAMGWRPTGGYHVRVQGAAAQGDHVAVRVVETSPGGSCVVTMATTTPVDAVRLPRTGLPVRFETVKAVHNCG